MTIRIVTEPSVYLVGGQSVDEEGLKRFLDDHEAGDWSTDTDVPGEQLSEVAGRLCYMSFARPRPGGNAAYIGHILEVGHGSVLEHAVFSLIFTGVSRSFTHELVRHRAGFGFSQLSQRYVDESDVAFVAPPALSGEIAAGENWLIYSGQGSARSALREIRPREPDGWMPAPYSFREGAGLRWIAACEQAQADYTYLSDYLTSPGASDLPREGRKDKTDRRKAAREAARSVLPNCTETKIFVTANARAWRHFIEMRADPAADAEMRRAAIAALVVLRDASPNIFGDYEYVAGPIEHATTRHRKV
jgi:thymidylate synthase (FAD)